MSRNVTYALLAVVGAIALAYLMRRHFVSHETRIRWRFHEMVDAFNDGSASSLSGHLADDFSVRKSAIDRNHAINILRAIFLRPEYRREDGSPLYRVEIIDTERSGEQSEEESDEEPIRINLKESEPLGADFLLNARFYRRAAADSGEPDESVAVIAFEGTCVLEDSRWRVLEVGRETKEGRLPFR